MKRWGWGAATLLLVFVTVWLAVPALLKWQLPLRMSEALGRTVTLRDVAFRPWAMSVTLDDLAVAGLTPSAQPLLQIGRLHANISAASLVRLAPVIEALQVDALRLNISRTGEGRYDIDDLISRFTPKPDARPATEPARFALYNVEVRDAQVRFDDRPVKRVQQVDALNLALPFVSSLPAHVEIKVAPRLAFRLNGTPFDSGAQATPFAQTRSGDLKLVVADLDLAPYLGYLPSSLPVRLTKGSVSADLNVVFAVPPGGAPSVAVKGQVGAKALVMTDAAGAPLLGWRALMLGLRDVQPLARRLVFDTLRTEGLQLHATRDAGGNINLLQLAPPPNAVANAAQAPASGASVPIKAGAAAWQVSLDSINLVDGRFVWYDAAVKPASALQFDGLTVSAKQVQWPLTKPVAMSLQGTLRAQAANSPALAELSAEGPVTHRDAKLAVKLSSVSLAGFAPYLAQALVPTVDGQLAAQAQLDWSAAADAPRMQLTLERLTLDNLKVREASDRKGRDSMALKQLALADVRVDLPARSISLGSVKLVQPAVQLLRDEAGRLNVQKWLPGSDAPTASAPVKPPTAAPAVWRVQLKDLLVEGGQL
ncbi:MAG: DUF748 domain-containing protein, partial [Rhizobiales bacterium]|nr:DUF748 domain-containing protein [Rhizobacter sp.]